jgi:hypothetical protein
MKNQPTQQNEPQSYGYGDERRVLALQKQAQELLDAQTPCELVTLTAHSVIPGRVSDKTDDLNLVFENEVKEIAIPWDTVGYFQIPIQFAHQGKTFAASTGGSRRR